MLHVITIFDFYTVMYKLYTRGIRPGYLAANLASTGIRKVIISAETRILLKVIAFQFIVIARSRYYTYVISKNVKTISRYFRVTDVIIIVIITCIHEIHSFSYDSILFHFRETWRTTVNKSTYSLCACDFAYTTRRWSHAKFKNRFAFGFTSSYHRIILEYGHTLRIEFSIIDFLHLKVISD